MKRPTKLDAKPLPEDHLSKLFRLCLHHKVILLDSLHLKYSYRSSGDDQAFIQPLFLLWGHCIELWVCCQRIVESRRHLIDFYRRQLSAIDGSQAQTGGECHCRCDVVSAVRGFEIREEPVVRPSYRQSLEKCDACNTIRQSIRHETARE